ncbi:hypothetical protein BDZ89DRAFT_1138543 [Hymenopellis radicata]|nr:hypothetical protein BDZ89DRAFT_1138543 [Hymenopellis radicata]
MEPLNRIYKRKNYFYGRTFYSVNMARCYFLILVFAFILASAVAVAANERAAGSEISVYGQLYRYAYDDVGEDDFEDTGEDDDDDYEDDDDDCDGDEDMTTFPGSSSSTGTGTLSSTGTVQVSGTPKSSLPTTASLTATSDTATSSPPGKPTLTTSASHALADTGGPFSFSGASSHSPAATAALTMPSSDGSLLTATLPTTLKSGNATSTTGLKLPSQRPESSTSATFDGVHISAGVQTDVPMWGVVVMGVGVGVYCLSM